MDAKPVKTLAGAQTIAAPGNVAANVEQHVHLAHAAANAGARIAVFPELSLTGYELELASELAFSTGDPRLAPLLDVAASRAITLVVGAPVRVDSSLHIGAFILAPDRRIGLYTKHHLGAFSSAASVDGVVPPGEPAFFEPGVLNPLVEVCGSPAAIAVCADVGRASHAQAAADRGATCYLASMFVIPSEFEGDAAKLRRYALQHSMTVVLSNYGGRTGGLAAAGRSGIWSPGGDLLVQLDRSGIGVALAIEDAHGWRGEPMML